MTAPAVLAIESLTVSYATREGPLQAVRNIDLTIGRGECVGLVGESGSGKSTISLAVMGLLDGEATIRDGRILFSGRELGTLSAEERRALRGDRISIVFQDPFTSLNPSLPIGLQVSEPLVFHRRLSPHEAREKAIAALGEVGLPSPSELVHAYPHQLSGGMQQRVLIATALICNPDLVVLDEPTTALDVTVEAGILDLLESLRQRHGLSMLFVTHNLGLVNRICDRVCVLYAGGVLEEGPTTELLGRPAHPYTKGLLVSVPRIRRGAGRRLTPIPGQFPDLTDLPSGCIFHPRCPYAEPRCRLEPQHLEAIAEGHAARCWKSVEIRDAEWPVTAAKVPAPRPLPKTGLALIAIDKLEKTFIGRTSFRGGIRVNWLGGFIPVPRLRRSEVHAVNGVSLSIAPGEVVGLVGESGSGKSTLGRCSIRLIEPNQGTVRLAGHDLLKTTGSRLRRLRGVAQMVFQNPVSSLNPRKTVGATLERAITLFCDLSPSARKERTTELLGKVGLSPAHAKRYPHQLSGGERQRVGIARAIATGPRFIVCDEPVSALDVSVQATVLNLLIDLCDELRLSYLFISHDLSVVAYIADRIAVMYGGQLVEEGPTDALLAPPYHPYTEALLSAVPLADPRVARRPRVRLRGDVTAAERPRIGCPFQHRCPRKIGRVCEEIAPPIVEASAGHRIRCHIPLTELRAMPPIFPDS